MLTAGTGLTLWICAATALITTSLLPTVAELKFGPARITTTFLVVRGETISTLALVSIISGVVMATTCFTSVTHPHGHHLVPILLSPEFGIGKTPIHQARPRVPAQLPVLARTLAM